jgi:hypothetical protein
MRHTFIGVIALVAAATLAGCGKSPGEGAKQTKLEVEEPGVNGGLIPSGRPEAPLIDPQKKTIVVLAAPSAPQLAGREEAKLATDHEKVEGRIQDLMTRYSGNLGNAAGKAKYEEQIGEELETYKRQSLQLYKLKRAAQLAASGDTTKTGN